MSLFRVCFVFLPMTNVTIDYGVKSTTEIMPLAQCPLDVSFRKQEKGGERQKKKSDEIFSKAFYMKEQSCGLFIML